MAPSSSSPPHSTMCSLRMFGVVPFHWTAIQLLVGSIGENAFVHSFIIILIILGGLEKLTKAGLYIVVLLLVASSNKDEVLTECICSCRVSVRLLATMSVLAGSVWMMLLLMLMMSSFPQHLSLDEIMQHHFGFYTSISSYYHHLWFLMFF